MKKWTKPARHKVTDIDDRINLLARNLAGPIRSQLEDTHERLERLEKAVADILARETQERPRKPGAHNPDWPV
jgi:hypothetical protein